MSILDWRAKAEAALALAPELPAGRPRAGLPGDDFYEPTRPARGAARDAGTRICGSAECKGGWVKPWRSRRRPVFEEEWGCSARCLTTLVRAAVRRETNEGTASGVDGSHRHRVPLGLVLLAQGWITHPQLQAALEAQKTTGQGRIGDWLVQGCGLAEERVTRGLGVQWSCPILTLTGFSPSAMALVMPKRFIVEFGLVPLRIAGSTLLYLGFEDRTNAATAFGLEQMTRMRVESGLLGGVSFATAKKALLAADSVRLTTDVVQDADDLCNRLTKVLEAKQPVASRLVRVHNYFWVRLWLESGALSGAGNIPADTADVEDYLFTIGETGPRKS